MYAKNSKLADKFLENALLEGFCRTSAGCSADRMGRRWNKFYCSLSRTT